MTKPWHVSAALAIALVVSRPAMGLDGATPLEITPTNIPGTDWRILELYTGGNTLTGIADAGYTQKTGFDGLGAFAVDPSTIRVFFNHEVTGASAVSYIDLSKPNLNAWLSAGTTTPASPVTLKIGTAHTSITGKSTLSRFCSSTMFEPNRFGAGLGMASRAYLTGEEVAGGSLYAIDSDPTSATFRTMFQCTALPTGSWENVAEFNTGRSDKVGLVLLEDAGSSASGTAPLRVWIGNKRDVDGSGSMSFLEKNGLAEGTVYYWIPSGSGTAAPSRFTATDALINGNWSTSNTGAMLFSKLEDGAVSPHNGSLLAFNSQDQGTFTLQLNMSFSGGVLDTGTSTAAVRLLLEEALDGGTAAGFNNQDNLAWSTSSLLFTQEDGDTQQIWQIDPSASALDRAALAIAQVTGGAGESSGIIDVSELLGYKPGSVLLTNSLSGTLADNQLVLMFSPTAELVPEPSSALAVLALSLLGRRRRRMPV